MRTCTGSLVLAWLSITVVAGSSCQSTPASMGADMAASCAPACASHQTCTGGVCVSDSVPDMSVTIAPPDLASTDGGACVPACSGAYPFCVNGRCEGCLGDGDCPRGSVCRAGAPSFCVPGCDGDGRCPTSDGGAALSCCSMACVDTAGDVLNCGGCGKACAFAHAASSCAAGVCAQSTCASGWADCNNNPGDGCEVNTRLDVGNCGACGTTCKLPHAVAGCAGACYVAACAYGYDDCDNNADTGCETAILTDPRNCGACNKSCPSPSHSKGTCTVGGCGLQCDASFADCNGNPVDGCESFLPTDRNNCGACGTVCAFGLACINGACTCPQCVLPNAKSACVNNVCALVSCLNGYADCDAVAKNGCEVNLLLDSSNCGKCGAACPMNLPACQAGVCGILVGPQQIPEPFTHDVVLNNGSGMLDPSQDAMDGSNNCLMTVSAGVSLAGNGTAGIPDNGFFAMNADHPDVQLAVNNKDDGFNARIMHSGDSYHLGTLPHRIYKGLQMYATATEQGDTISVTLNYSDNSTDSHSFTITDWFKAIGANQFSLIKGLQRYSIGNKTVDNQKVPEIVGFDLKPDPTKQLNSVDLTVTAGPGWFVYFGAVGW